MTPRGQTLTFVQQLGSGTFGVANAVKTRKGDVLCLKEIQVQTADESARAEALNEVDLLKSCKHANIVTYHDSWFDRHRLYILMEYAPNGSLDCLITQYAKQGKTFSAHKVTHFLHEMVAALHYCHEVLHVMHRDIKPANVLIDQLGTLKLADFGLSKPLDANRAMCVTFVGTPLYMAPEQCAGEAYSYPADVWSLGCILFELMALRSPWSASGPCTYPVHVRRVAHGVVDFSPLSAYPIRLVETAKWMLHKTTTSRATTSELLDILEMRSPPTVHPVATPLPVDVSDAFVPKPVKPGHRRAPPRQLEHNDSLERRRQLLEEAKNMAAMSIQRCFRASAAKAKETAAKAKETAAADVKAAADKVVEAYAAHVVPAKPKYVEPEQYKVEPRFPPVAPVAVIQRAMRTSLNRRRRLPAIGKPAEAPPPRKTPLKPAVFHHRAAPRRIDTLATPRGGPKPRVVGAPPVRPAWV